MKTISEDWLAVWLGLLIFALSLAGFAGVDLLGWAVTTAVWTVPAKALVTASKAYAALPGVVSLLLTYIFLLAILLAGAKALKLPLGATSPQHKFWISPNRSDWRHARRMHFPECNECDLAIWSRHYPFRLRDLGH